MIRSSFPWSPNPWLLGVLVAAALLLFAPEGWTAEIIFLQDGRAIRAEKTEVVGDRIRIERPAQTIELPRSAVLSVLPVSPPSPSPPPAEVYRDLTQQMTDRVRREIQERPGASRTK